MIIIIIIIICPLSQNPRVISRAAGPAVTWTVSLDVIWLQSQIHVISSELRYPSPWRHIHALRGADQPRSEGFRHVTVIPGHNSRIVQSRWEDQRPGCTVHLAYQRCAGRAASTRLPYSSRTLSLARAAVPDSRAHRSPYGAFRVVQPVLELDVAKHVIADRRAGPGTGAGKPSWIALACSRLASAVVGDPLPRSAPRFVHELSGRWRRPPMIGAGDGAGVVHSPRPARTWERRGAGVGRRPFLDHLSDVPGRRSVQRTARGRPGAYAVPIASAGSRPPWCRVGPGVLTRQHPAGQRRPRDNPQPQARPAIGMRIALHGALDQGCTRSGSATSR